MTTRKNNQAVAAFVEQIEPEQTTPEQIAQQHATRDGTAKRSAGAGRSGKEQTAPWELTPSELFPGTHQTASGAQTQDEAAQGGVLKRLLQGRKLRQAVAQGSGSAGLNDAGQAQTVTASKAAKAGTKVTAAGRAGANGTAVKGLKGRSGKKVQTKSGTANAKARLSKDRAAAGKLRSASAQAGLDAESDQLAAEHLQAADSPQATVPAAEIPQTVVPETTLPSVPVRELEFSWEVAREALMERSEHRAWLVARGAVCLSIGLALSLCALLPLKSVEPYVIEVDKSNGMSRVLHLASSEEIPVDEMSHKYWLTQYVLAREGYDWRTLNQEYYKVRELSLPEVFESYASLYGEDKEDSLERQYRDEVRIRVMLKSVVVHNDHIATVRLSKVRYDNRSGLETGREHLTATLAFEYFPDFNVPEERRLINPFGFKVTSYRTDPEHEDGVQKSLPGTAQETQSLMTAAEGSGTGKVAGSPSGSVPAVGNVLAAHFAGGGINARAGAKSNPTANPTQAAQNAARRSYAD